MLRDFDGTLGPVPTPTIETLRNVPLFAELDDHALEHIVELAGEFTARRGQLLIERGQPGMGLFLVEDGTVAVEIDGEDPIELGPGDFFGEIAVLTDHHRTARVRAVTEVKTLAIARKDLFDLLEDHPEVAVVMLREVARRLASML